MDGSGKVVGNDLEKNKAKEPLAYLLADVVGQDRISMNLVWTLVTGFLVMFMQAGFALVETGFTRLKNAAHTMMMNFMVYGLGMLGYFIAGFAFQFGGIGAIASLGGTAPLTAPGGEWVVQLFGKPFGLLGTNGFFLAGGTYDVAVAVLFLFQMVFMDTAATIPTGAMAERWKWSGFAVFALFCSTLTYPVFGNWAWGGGWLSQLGVNFGLGHGYVDFAGSGVVHATGGWMGLAGAMVLGPRIGKYNKDGSVNAIPGHNLTLAALGTFILAFGWFGFGPGAPSALESRSQPHRVDCRQYDARRHGRELHDYVLQWIRHNKPDPGMMINGLLAGLVAITAPSGFVSPVNSVIIGGIAGVLVIGSVWAFDHIFRVDDPVGAISVHGVCGTWGCFRSVCLPMEQLTTRRVEPGLPGLRRVCSTATLASSPPERLVRWSASSASGVSRGYSSRLWIVSWAGVSLLPSSWPGWTSRRWARSPIRQTGRLPPEAIPAGASA